MPQNPDVLASLRRLDLNQYEAKAYYALAAAGECTAGELSSRAGLPRPRSYDVLNSLAGKGFVAISPSRPVVYKALGLQEAIRTLRRKRQESLVRDMATVEGIAGDLANKLYSTTSSESAGEAGESVWTLRGRSALYSRLAGMLESAKKNILISSTPAGVSRKLEEYGKLLEKAKSRGVHVAVASALSKEKAVEAARIAQKVHLLELPTRMVVADDQALLFLTGEETDLEEELGVWIRNPHVATTLRRLVPETRQ